MTSPERPGTGFRKYLGNSAWIMGNNVLTSATGFVVLAVVARYLGPGEYGSYAYVFALAQLFAVLGHAGLDALLTRELVEKPAEQDAILGTAATLRFAGYAIGAVACLVYGLANVNHSYAERWLFFSAFLYILLLPLPAVFTCWFSSRIEARHAMFGNMAGALAGGAAKIALVLLGGGVIAIGFAQALTAAIILLVTLRAFRSRGGGPLSRWHFDSRRSVELLSESWKVFLAAVFAMVYLKIDQVMLRWYGSLDEVGIYAVVARLSEVLYFVPAAIAATVFPRLVEIRKQNEASFDRLFFAMLVVMVFLSYVMTAVILAAGPGVLRLLFGAGYEAGGTALRIHVLSMPLIALMYALSPWLLAVKFVRFALLSHLIGAVSNVALNLFLIPAYGMTGAALATVLSYALACYFAVLFSRRTRPLFVMMSKALFMPWRVGAAVRALKAGAG